MNANQDAANRLREQKDYQQALQIYLDLLRQYPDNGEIYQWIAKCYYELKNYDEAFSASKEAIRLDRNLSLPHLILAYISVHQGNLEDAALEAQDAYNLSPEVDEVSNCYGALLLSTGKLDESIAVLRHTLELHPNSILAHQNLATAYRKKKDYKRYTEAMRLVYKHNPNLLNAIKLLVAYQQRYAFLLSLIVFSALIGAWLFRSRILLAIPVFMVIYGLLGDLTFIIRGSWKRKGNLRVLLSSLIADCMLGVFTYLVYVALNSK